MIYQWRVAAVSAHRLQRTIIALALLVSFTGAAAAEPLRIYAAGSLRATFAALLEAFGTPQGGAAQTTYGPSGVLRERLEHGEITDLFASADLAQPRRLVAAGHGTPVVVFARNQMCALARAALGITPANMLDRLLDPALKLATSTPGADPSGDYAWAVFDRAERLHPGAKAMLEGKAQQLVGAPGKALLVPGHGATEGVFLSGRADIMLGYCSGVQAFRAAVPDLVAVKLPPELEVAPAYGMTVLSGNPEAFRFALFVMSETGQAIVAREGLIPIGASTP